MPLRGRSTLGVLLLLLACSSLSAAAAPTSLPGRESRIANGLPTQTFPSTGWLLIQSFGGTGFCSGVLVGCHTFLTAAHCICTDSSGNVLTGSQCLQRPDLLNPAGKTVFLQNAGNFAVSSIAVDPDFQFGVDGDFAVLTLATAVTGVAPSPLNTTARPPAGTAGTIVGFGLSGGSRFDVGIKRTGQVETATCPASLGVPNSTNLCWIYQNPLGPPGADSDTCEGDSGGPLFVDLGQGPVLAGLTSGGTTNCVPTDDSFDSDVFVDRAFLTATAGGDLGTASCGGLPAIGDPGAVAVPGSGNLSAAAPSQLFTVEVPPGTQTLRIALNNEGDADFDLFAKLGSTASPQNFDCKSTDPELPDVCEIPSPSPGSWSLLVERSAGSGDFQLTTTYYSTSASPAEAFYTLPPCRLVDTRNPAGPLGGPALASGTVRNFPLAGACGVPSDAKALSVNLTVTQPTASGFLRLYPGDFPSPPLASSINFSAGQTRSNNAILALPANPADGIDVRCDSAGAVQLIVDVNGYFR